MEAFVFEFQGVKEIKNFIISIYIWSCIFSATKVILYLLMTILRYYLVLLLLSIQLLHIHLQFTLSLKIRIEFTCDFLSSGGEVEYRTSFSEREPCTIKKSKTGAVPSEFKDFLGWICVSIGFKFWLMLSLLIIFPRSEAEKFSKNPEQFRRRRMNLDHPRIIDVQNHRYRVIDFLFSHSFLP